jgi:hypothetical protein
MLGALTMWHKWFALAGLAASVSGCQRWGSRTTNGPAVETGRELIVVDSRCVRRVHYEAAYEVRPVVENRNAGVFLGALSQLTGTAIFVGTITSSISFDDPDCTGDCNESWERSQNVRRGIAGGLVLAGLVLTLYAATADPRGPKPEPKPGKRQWLADRPARAGECAAPSPGAPAN